MVGRFTIQIGEKRRVEGVTPPSLGDGGGGSGSGGGIGSDIGIEPQSRRQQQQPRQPGRETVVLQPAQKENKVSREMLCENGLGQDPKNENYSVAVKGGPVSVPVPLSAPRGRVGGVRPVARKFKAPARLRDGSQSALGNYARMPLASPGCSPGRGGMYVAAISDEPRNSSERGCENSVSPSPSLPEQELKSKLPTRPKMQTEQQSAPLSVRRRAFVAPSRTKSSFHHSSPKRSDPPAMGQSARPGLASKTPSLCSLDPGTKPLGAMPPFKLSFGGVSNKERQATVLSPRHRSEGGEGGGGQGVVEEGGQRDAPASAGGGKTWPSRRVWVPNAFCSVADYRSVFSQAMQVSWGA